MCMLISCKSSSMKARGRQIDITFSYFRHRSFSWIKHKLQVETKSTSGVTNIVSFLPGSEPFLMSLVQFDAERKVTGIASHRQPLIAQTLWTACYKVKTEPKTSGIPLTCWSLPTLDKLSQYMIDVHANITEDFLKDSSITFR